jgi:hypothetical protein
MPGSPHARRSHPERCGASLVELLAAMTAASVVMATAVDLVHRGYRIESRSRHTIADERTAVRLAREFRADVHAAGTARCATAADAAWLVVLDGPAGMVTYAATPAGLERITQPAAGPPTREAFSFFGAASWGARRDGRLVSLSGTSTAADGRRPPVVVDIVAALDERSAATGGEAP